MPAICTANASAGSCSHRQIVVDGVTLHLHDNDLTPLSTEEKVTLYTLAIRHKGVALANLLNRVIHGDEATNVKTYDLVPPGAAITKTNIGTAYVDVLPGANGQRVLVDLTGCTEFLLVLTANLVGTGAFGFRVIRDSDGAVLFENAAIAQTGERELNTGWQPLPLTGTQELVRLQAKSVTATDDPVVRRCQLLVR